MRLSRFVVVGLVMTLVFTATAFQCSARPKDLHPLPTGTWGGDHITMTVSAEGAELEFDCARANINEPIVLDSKGNFRVTGTYRAEHAAPSQAGENQQPEATFTGSVKGDTMRLEIAVAGLADKMEFTLKQGEDGRLTKCA